MGIFVLQSRTAWSTIHHAFVNEILIYSNLTCILITHTFCGLLLINKGLFMKNITLLIPLAGLMVLQPFSAHADLSTGSLSLSGDGETFDYVDQAYSTANGLTITFSFSSWGDYMADGFTLALFGADTTPIEAGAEGGALGYANRYTTVSGLSGGILGVGFDAHGNFSTSTEGRNGGLTTRVPNSIALRGSMGSSSTDGYEYITGTDSLEGFMNDGRTSTQEDAVTRDIRITVTADETVSVEWKLENEQNWTTLIDAVDASEQMELTDQVKVGITSSLNGATNVLIDSLEVIPEPAIISLCILAGGGLLCIRRIFTR
jgi:hypothetical protein